MLNNVYLLNLDSRKDRLPFMDFKLKELDISYKKITAILGSNYKKEYDKYYNNVKNKIEQKYIINSLGAYGLLLTYKNIIVIYSSINNHIVVLEDDICFHHNFKNQLLKYENIINKHDVVWLGSQVFKWSKEIDSNVNKNGYHNVIFKNKNQYENFLVWYILYCVFS